MSVARIKGVEVEFSDGSTLVVPPLSLAAVEEFQDRLKNFDPSNRLGNVTLVVDVLFSCLKRNYPDMTRSEAAELVDLANMQKVMFACMNVSGMVEKSEGASGEARRAES